MIDVMYAMEESTLESFINFKSELDKLKAMATPNQIDKVKAEMESLQLSTRQSFEVDEQTGIAYIDIKGTLTPRAEVCVSLSDGSQTLYPSIVEAVRKAEMMPSVREIVFNIDSPGGYVSGIDTAAMAIKHAQKPTTSVVHGMCCSAAYWLASQTDKIVADTRIAQIGSIGVIVEAIDRSKKDDKDGIKRYILTSENATEKFQDVGTEKGRNKIVERLTATEEVFISRIAEGRKISKQSIKENFGQGGVFIAEKALKIGMIDGINELNNSLSPQSNNTITASDEENKNKGVSMNLEEILKQNPEAKAEIETLKNTAKAEGSKNETARVNELLILSGVIVSPELQKAIGDGQTAGDYAMAKVKNDNKITAAAKKDGLDKLDLSGNSQTPADSKVEDKKEQKVEGAIDEDQAKALAKKLGGNK